MKLKMLLAFAFFMFSFAAFSATWVAMCNDGQRFQYNQTVDGNGFLYLKTNDGASGGVQIAKLTQTFNNGVAICGTVIGNGNGNTGEPITQVCANKSRNIIYIKYIHPYESQPVKSYTYCTATVTIH